MIKAKTWADRMLQSMARRRSLEAHAAYATLRASHDGISIVRVTADGYEHVSPEDFYLQPTPTPEERRLMALTDDELLAEIAACDFEDPRSELLYGEAERRDLDI